MHAALVCVGCGVRAAAAACRLLLLDAGACVVLQKCVHAMGELLLSIAGTPKRRVPSCTARASRPALHQRGCSPLIPMKNSMVPDLCVERLPRAAAWVALHKHRTQREAICGPLLGL